MQPASSAGTSLLIAMNNGTFHGMIAVTTPMGSRTHERLAVDAVADVFPGELVCRTGVVLERRHRGAVLHHVDDRRRLTGLGGSSRYLSSVGAILHAA